MNNEQTLAAIGRVVDELNYSLECVDRDRMTVVSPNGARITVETFRIDLTPEVIRQYLQPALDRGAVRA